MRLKDQRPSLAEHEAPHDETAPSAPGASQSEGHLKLTARASRAQWFKIDLETTAARDVDQISPDHRHLLYKLIAAPGKQPVTRGRLMAEPVLNLNDYRCRAVFDWLEFEVELGRNIRARELARSINAVLKDDSEGKAWVYGPERRKGYEGSCPRIKLHDPTLSRVRAVLALLGTCHKAARDGNGVKHRITGLELAIDFYPKNSAVENEPERALLRARMSELLRQQFKLNQLFRQKGFFDEAEEMPRFADDAGQKKLIKLRPGQTPLALQPLPKILHSADEIDKHRHAPLNATYYVGARSLCGEIRPVMYRLQDKVTDKREGNEAVDLEPRHRRSRVEVALHNIDDMETCAGLGIETVDNITATRWEQFRKTFFEFQLATLAMDGKCEPLEDELAVFRATGALGHDLYLRSRNAKKILTWKPEHGRKPEPMREKGHAVAFVDLNKMIGRAMSRAHSRFAV